MCTQKGITVILLVPPELQMHWYVNAFKNYAVFSGRAGRAEYWTFFLISMLMYICLHVIFMVSDSRAVAGSIEAVYVVSHFIPTLAIGSRRLHDTGRSGWWQLILVVPIVGPIALLVLLARAGIGGHNAYGPEPQLVSRRHQQNG
ncbi:DUF805 domain-containing protein [Streptomyces sp. NPDC019396]|uniref:DUF805 domain-containing protein n=1 Tax=Streptomyces sp. NPDC019396 TaxID=3154687 RepID=UPI0033F48309